MKQKASLIVGVVALVAIIWSLIKPTPQPPPHGKLPETCSVLKSNTAGTSLKNYQVDFYMENSASMDGYVNGNTEFKDVLGKMIVSSHHACKGTDFYFVNSQVYKANESAIDFIQMLNPANIKVGNVGSTDVNQIFRNILKEECHFRPFLRLYLFGYRRKQPAGQCEECHHRRISDGIGQRPFTGNHHTSVRFFI